MLTELFKNIIQLYFKPNWNTTFLHNLKLSKNGYHVYACTVTMKQKLFMHF